MTKPNREITDEEATYSPRNILNDCGDAILATLRLAASSPDYAQGMRDAIGLLSLQQRGRARALRILDKNSSASDPRTLAMADAYEECGNELLEAIRALPVPDGREEIQSSDGGVVATTQASSSLEDKPDPLRHPVGGSINNHLSREAEVAPGPSEANATGDERPEDRAEQIIQAAIDNAPEPLKRLGAFLTGVLDEDHWPTAERMLLALAANSAGQEPDAWSYECEFGDGWARHVVFHKPQGNEWQRNIKPLYYAAPPSLDREAIALMLARKFPTTFTPYGNAKSPNAFASNVADAILSLITGARQTRAEPSDAGILRAYREFNSEPHPTSFEAFERAIRALGADAGRKGS